MGQKQLQPVTIDGSNLKYALYKILQHLRYAESYERVMKPMT